MEGLTRSCLSHYHVEAPAAMDTIVLSPLLIHSCSFLVHVCHPSNTEILEMVLALSAS